MFIPHHFRPLSPEWPLGPAPIQRVSPVQALNHFFPQASQAWSDSLSQQQDAPPLTLPQTAAEVMHFSVTSVRQDTPLRELMQVLAQGHPGPLRTRTPGGISGVPVVNSEGVPVGVISLTDVAHYLGRYWLQADASKELSQEDLGDTPVEAIMSPFVCFAEEGASLTQLADAMLEHQVHRLIVLREGQMVGIISSLDLIQAFVQPLRSEV